MQIKKSSLASLSNEALCKLRDEIAALLNSRAEALRREIDQLTGKPVAMYGHGKQNRYKAKGNKIASKYRGPDGGTWSGRGLKPRWLTSELKAGKKLEDFLIVKIDDTAAKAGADESPSHIVKHGQSDRIKLPQQQ